MFFRVKPTGSYAYLPIAESFREVGGVRQWVLCTLGRLDLFLSTGQLDALLRSGARFRQRVLIGGAHPARQTEPVAVRRIGPDLIFGRHRLTCSRETEPLENGKERG